jgi:tetratricopeptide (TPR) repeat protein
MERIEKTVFISYRRTNIPWALAIFQNLTQYGFDVFFDYNGIASGDFESVILGNITARAHFLVLLTPSALEHCGEPGDWLRREIETALNSRRNIVPLMLEGFDFGSPKIASQLTGKLADLKRYNGLSIPPDYFLEAMGRLRDRFLNVPLTSVLHPASSSAQLAAREQRNVANAALPVQTEELTAQQWFERGVDAVDLDEKLRFYREAIRLKPDYAGAFNNRGAALHVKGDLEGAIRDFNEAIRLEPSDPMAFVNRGAVRYDKGDFEGALKDYDEAIRLKPDNSEAFNNRGNACYAKGDIEEALKDYKESIRFKPDFAMAFMNQGLARYDKGDIDGALKDYNKAIRFQPDFADAIGARGIVRLRKGDLRGGLKDFNKAIRLKPDLVEVFYNRGLVRFAKGDFDGALKDYNEVILLKPDDAMAFYKRSITLDAMGDKEGAREDCDEAMRLGYKPKA